MAMNRFKRLTLFVVFAAFAALFSACSTPPKTTSITIPDLRATAEKMLEDLYTCGVLDTVAEDFPDDKPVITVGKIIDRTSCRVQTSVLANRIFDSLSRSGHVAVMTADRYASETAEYERLLSGKKGDSETVPALVLSGKISEGYVREGRVETRNYELRLALNKGSTEIWSNTLAIDKSREY